MCLSCAEAIEFGLEPINPCLCGAPETQAAMQRIEADLNRRQVLGGAAAVIGMFAGFGLAPREVRAQTRGQATLLTNLRFFDGTTLSMQTGRDILVEGGRITALVPAGTGPAEAVVIDCGARSVTPGLIDCHWHSTLVSVSQIAALTQDIAFVHLVAGQEAGATLMRGFTTVRDTGGPAFGLKLAVDNGVVAGPRIFPSGAMISQTSGHGDFRLLNTLPRLPGDVDYTERTGVAALADGRDEVLRRTREQLMKGATQIKIMAGGGVASPYDPLETAQFTLDEMRAAVEAAQDYGTYVCAHVYTPTGILRCIEAGVRSIEHGQLADAATIRAMAEAGVWWSIQPFLADADANQYTDPRSIAKQEQVSRGTVQAFEMGRAEGVNMAFGTDILMNPGASQSQGRQLAKLARFMPPLEALRMATGNAGNLLALSGPRDPYQGRLGLIAEGAHADILVWDGDPETDLGFLDDPTNNLRLVMKGGRVFKETL